MKFPSRYIVLNSFTFLFALSTFYGVPEAVAQDAQNSQGATQEEELSELDLEKYKELHPDLAVAVFDTYGKIKKPSSSYSYDADVKELTEIQNLAEQLNIAIVLMHHARKGVQDQRQSDRSAEIKAALDRYGASRT